LKKIISGMSLVLVLILGLVGCNTSNKTEETTGSTTNNNEEAKGDSIVLTSSSHTPPGPMSDAFDAYLDEIEKRSDGRITFERFYQGTLVGGTDTIDALKNGVVDIALVNPSQQSGRIELGTVATNPAIFNNPWAANKAMSELYETIPELRQELDQVGVIDVGWVTMPSAYIMSPSKEMTKVEDLKGLRMLTNTRAITSLMDEVGATPVGIPIVEFYEALSRGTADAVTISYQAGETNGIDELAKHVWELPVGGGNMFYGMSKQVWDDLPEDLREIITDVRNDFQSDSFYQVYVQKGEGASHETFKNNNIDIKKPSEEVVKEFIDQYAKHVWNSWVKETESAGKPGQQIMDTFIELEAKYEAEFPFEAE
jgi:TRAP-type C4-dicarboxylate transport system substrate-binding protein